MKDIVLEVLETTSHCTESSYESLSSLDSAYELESLSVSSRRKPTSVVQTCLESKDLVDEEPNNIVDDPPVEDDETSSHYPTISFSPQQIMVSAISIDELEMSMRSKEDPRAQFEALKLRLSETTFLSKEDMPWLSMKSVAEDLESEVLSENVTSNTRPTRSVCRKSSEADVSSSKEPNQSPSFMIPSKKEASKPQRKQRRSKTTEKRKNRSSKKRAESSVDHVSRTKRRASRKSRASSASCNVAGQVVENCEGTAFASASTPPRRSKSTTEVLTIKAQRSASKQSQPKSTESAVGTPKTPIRSVSKNATKPPKRCNSLPQRGRSLWASMTRLSIFKER